MKKKKILVTTDFIGEGGHSEVLYQTARLLKDEGYEFIVATTRYRSEIVSQEFFRIVELPRQLEGQLQIVLALIEEEQISLLVDLGLSELVFKIKSITPPLLIKTSFWLHSKPFWQVDREESVWELATRTGWKRVLRLPLIRSCVLPLLKCKKFAEERARWQRNLEIYDYIIVLTPGDIPLLMQQLGLPAAARGRFVALINPAESRQHPVLDKKKQVVFAGRLEFHSKRVDRLVRIWSRVERSGLCPDWHLKIYGDGWYREELEKEIQHLGLERCTLEGYSDDMDSVFSESAINCMVSQYEGFPMSLIEAQANGCIPMAFDVCEGIKYIIGEGNKAGILVPPFDEKKYAEELLSLMQDDFRRTKLQKAALEKVKDYDMAQNLPVWEELYQRSAPNPPKEEA